MRFEATFRLFLSSSLTITDWLSNLFSFFVLSNIYCSSTLGNVTAAVTVFAGLQGRIKEDASYFRLTGAGGVQAAFKGGYGWQFLCLLYTSPSPRD